jgi:biopolymer transport protein ExbD
VIFFVVTSKVGDSQFLSLDLPKTESFEYNLVEINNEISITSSGNVYINGEIYNINDLDQIEAAIFNLNNNSNSIVLSAEASSLHIWIVGIMDILNKNGFNEVQIRTIEK